MGESAKRFPTRAVNQVNRARTDCEGWEGKNPQTENLSIRWKTLLGPDDSWCDVVCVKHREWWVGVKKMRERSLS